MSRVERSHIVNRVICFSLRETIMLEVVAVAVVACLDMQFCSLHPPLESRTKASHQIAREIEFLSEEQ